MQKKTNLFESAFGKAPKKGYKYNSLHYEFGWRSIVISWSCRGIGFGQLVLIFTPKGLEIDSEGMSSDFIESTLNETIKRLKKGQKATKWVKNTQNSKIQESVDSEENHELLIASICSTFLFLLKKKSTDLKIQ